MKNIQKLFLTAIFILFTGLSQAAEVDVEIRGDISGILNDGDVISVGRLICREQHIGVQVKILAYPQDGNGDKYVVAGHNDSRHKLKLRLKGNGWKSQAETDGIMKNSSDMTEVFYVVADGQQKPVADSYKIRVSGACVLPD